MDTNACKLDYYQANGATSNCLNDAEMEWLKIRTGRTGAVNDLWLVVLTATVPGTETIADGLREFWKNEGCGS